MAQNQAVVIALRGHGAAVERAVGAELIKLAQETANTMKRLAPKGANSHLVQSIKVDKTGPMAFEIGAHMAYAPYVEEGRKPGKGLPHLSDPASRSPLEWLRSTPWKGVGPVQVGKPRWARQGSKKRSQQEDDLRQRYFGLSRHVKAFGIKAQPFVKPAFDELVVTAPDRVASAVRAVLARGAAA
jgi:hypothetical protein